MKEPIKCDETTMLSSRQTYIRFTYVSEDGVTPSERIVRIGDRDPISGEIITKELIQQYIKIHNSEVYYNRRAMTRPWNKAQTEARKADRQRIAKELEEKYGDGWGKDTVDYELKKIWGSQLNIYMDSMTDEDGENYAENKLPITHRDVESEIFGNGDETSLLREFAETLSDELRDIFQLMLDRKSECTDRITAEDLARKWNTNRFRIIYEQQKIEEMIAEFFRKHYQNLTKWYPEFEQRTSGRKAGK